MRVILLTKLGVGEAGRRVVTPNTARGGDAGSNTNADLKQRVLATGPGCFFIVDSDGNIELIQWFRRWDDWSEEELGVLDNQDRAMLLEDWQAQKR